jgi:hypothetical protein
LASSVLLTFPDWQDPVLLAHTGPLLLLGLLLLPLLLLLLLLLLLVSLLLLAGLLPFCAVHDTVAPPPDPWQVHV